ncbi:MAG: APC family permease [Thermoleophilia bacterium]|nr:APC family permease [Thermoleophilia bacterium]
MAKGSEVDRLKPNAIGLAGVLFIAVTGAAPISAMLFNVPFGVGFGNGQYMPAAFLFATIVLTLFSIGYVSMAKRIRAAGGFYTFVTHGLGRELGLATGICGALAYCLFEVSLLGGFSYFASTNFNSWFGWEIPWILFALGAAALIAIFAWFDVALSVKILGVALITEIIILAIFDAVVLAQGGASGWTWEALNIFNITESAVGADGAVIGAAGVGVFLAFWSWVGFEAIPNFAEESRHPVRNIPRATLIAVVGLGIGYVITSFAFVTAFAPDELIAAAGSADDPPFFAAMEKYGSNFLRTVMEILILTGAFACAMAFHNVAMRYFYALGREGMIPRQFGATHSKHKVPHVASLTQTAIAVVILAVWGIVAGFGYGAAFDAAYVRIYTMMAVQGVVWLLAIQTVCAVAVIVWHQREKLGDNVLVTTVAPLLAIVGQVWAIYLLFTNIDTLAGTIGYVAWIKWIAIAGLVVSLVYALALKNMNRAKYDAIGQTVDSVEHV